jgi:hypothetical protein
LYAHAVVEGMRERDEPGEFRFLWRGQPDWHWGLQTSLYRHVRTRIEAIPDRAQFESREDDIWRAFSTAGLNAESRLLSNLALMQHHGVPTRLLDVSTDFWPALYFASESPATIQELNQPGVVFGFGLSSATNALNADAIGSLNQLRQELDKARSALVYFPMRVTPRITAQRGAFLVGAHHNGVGERLTFRWQLPEWAEGTFETIRRGRLRVGRPTRTAPLIALRIPAVMKTAVLRYLAQTYRLEPRTIYPDIEGFARTLEA